MTNTERLQDTIDILAKGLATITVTEVAKMLADVPIKEITLFMAKNYKNIGRDVYLIRDI